MKAFLWFSVFAWAIATMVSFGASGIAAESPKRNSADVRGCLVFGLVSVVALIFSAYALGGMP